MPHSQQTRDTAVSTISQLAEGGTGTNFYSFSEMMYFLVEHASGSGPQVSHPQHYLVNDA